MGLWVGSEKSGTQNRKLKKNELKDSKTSKLKNSKKKEKTVLLENLKKVE